MSFSDSHPGRPTHVPSTNGDPQGPLRAGPWGERQAWDHATQRWVVVRPGRPPRRAPATPPPPSDDDAHEARHGHRPNWGTNSRKQSICHECRRLYVANWRAKHREVA